MKAIVTNGKKSMIYTLDLEFDKLKEFIANSFPKMNNAEIVFPDKNGGLIPITCQGDIEKMKAEHKGQNFVQIDLRPPKKGDNPEFKNKIQRKCFLISKSCGGEPEQYAEFVQKHNDMNVNEITKLYCELNGIEPKKDPHLVRVRFLKKNFGGQIFKYFDFEKKNQDLPLGQLIKLYAKQSDLPVPQFQDNEKVKRKAGKLGKHFHKPQENFVEIVEDNPQMNFKELLEQLKAKGMEIDKEEIKKEKKQQKTHLEKKEKKVNKGKSISKEKLLKLLKEKNQESEELLTPNPKQVEIRTKGKLLLTMKQFFGEGRAKEYFAFINENFELGEQQILDKWIETHEN